MATLQIALGKITIVSLILNLLTYFKDVEYYTVMSVMHKVINSGKFL